MSKPKKEKKLWPAVVTFLGVYGFIVILAWNAGDAKVDIWRAMIGSFFAGFLAFIPAYGVYRDQELKDV